MATYATLTVPVLDIIGADFNTSRASVWIEPNVPVVLADSIRVGGRREQVVGGVATFANLVTTDSADNPASFGYRVTITAPPKGAAGRKDIVTLTTADFPFTATANLKDIPEAWDNIVLPVEWRSAFRDEMEALRDDTATISGLTGEDAAVAFLVEDSGSATAGALSATYARKVVITVAADGTGDHTTLAAAFAATPAGGANIRVKRGTYTVTSSVNVPSNTIIAGEGEGSVIKLANSGTWNCLNIPGTNVVVRDLKIDGNKANTAYGQNGIAITGQNVRIDSVRVVNANGYNITTFIGATDVTVTNCISEGAATEGIEIQACLRAVVSNNLVRNCGGHGIYVYAQTTANGASGVCTDVTVSGNTVQGCTNMGIRVDDRAENVAVSGNTITGCAYGIGVHTQTAYPVKNVSVTGNSVNATTTNAGIYLAGTNSNGLSVDGCTVTGNVIKGAATQGVYVGPKGSQIVVANNVVTSAAQDGIYSESPVSIEGNIVTSCGGTSYSGIKTLSTTDLTIVGNRVTLSGNYGILVSGCTGAVINSNHATLNRFAGIAAYQSSYGTISGNVCRSNGTAATVPYGIFVYRGTGNVGWMISGNRAYDTQGTKTQTYGLLVSGAADDLVIGPNLFTGNLTGTQSIDGTATNVRLVTPV